MSLEVAMVRRAAPKMVEVWRGSLEEGGVLPMSLDVAMVWRASPEMVVVWCTTLEEAVVQGLARGGCNSAGVARGGLGWYTYPCCTGARCFYQRGPGLSVIVGTLLGLDILTVM